jgi:hypothetical protein
VRPALNKFRNGVCHFLLPLQPMDWINLKWKVTWKCVQVNYVFMKTVVPDMSLNELFAEFSCVQKYCERKLEMWNERMKKCYWKWCELLAHFIKENINAVNI